MVGRWLDSASLGKSSKSGCLEKMNLFLLGLNL
jgi:hypothetical protein